MKKQGFIKNKVMQQHVVASVDKANWISHTNVISPTFEGDDGDDVWRVRSQHHPSVTYKIRAPITEYASCTCECALRSNFCKHQIVVLLTCTNLTMENIIEYYIMYYGLIVVVWNACLLSWDTYNWMMVHLMMKIATKI
jgi:hypothetical protein